MMEAAAQGYPQPMASAYDYNPMLLTYDQMQGSMVAQNMGDAQSFHMAAERPEADTSGDKKTGRWTQLEKDKFVEGKLTCSRLVI